MTSRKSAEERIQDTFRVFEKVNPSQHAIEEGDQWKISEARLHDRFLREYRLPPSLLNGCKILDVGCGTGEKSMIFASWGATVTGIDYNMAALERAQFLAQRSGYAARSTFLHSNLPILPAEVADTKFDICHADGVLHHAFSDMYAAVVLLMGRVASGGWLIIRNYQHLTALQRLLKRVIANIGAQGVDELIASNVTRLFGEDIERSVNIHGRDRQQAIYDNFVVQQYQPLDLRTVIRACHAESFQIYAVCPTIDAPALLGPGDLVGKILEDAQVMQWWHASLASTLVATERVPARLRLLRQLLQTCAERADGAERAIEHLITGATSAAWKEVVHAVRAYLNSYLALMDEIHSLNAQEISGFLEELDAVGTAVEAGLTQDQVVSELPKTNILFKRMSGMPMASWVLHKPASTPPNPFTV